MLLFWILWEFGWWAVDSVLSHSSLLALSLCLFYVTSHVKALCAHYFHVHFFFFFEFLLNISYFPFNRFHLEHKEVRDHKCISVMSKPNTTNHTWMYHFMYNYGRMSSSLSVPESVFTSLKHVSWFDRWSYVLLQVFIRFDSICFGYTPNSNLRVFFSVLFF